MGGNHVELSGPDFEAGIALSEVKEDQPLLGHAGGEAVVLVRKGAQVFAIGATCTHYSGPLAEGLVVGETLRCPWHHACFSLRTGEATKSPALNPLPTWRTEVQDDRVFVREKNEDATPETRARTQPKRVVIVGAGAAGSAAAEMLRRYQYDGAITLIDPDRDAPYDRPNLSKDYLAGNAPEEWLPLWPEDFAQTHRIERVVATVKRIDATAHSLELNDGRTFSYDVLLLATGARPRSIAIPGSDLPHVHMLRSLHDCRRIIAGIEHAKQVVVLGSSFIGLEVAASLRARGKKVTVVAPEEVPFARVFGEKLGRFVQQLHESKGVSFRLGMTPERIGPARVTLKDGASLAADAVIVGIGVSPALELAESAGLHVDKGVLVNEYLQTSDPDIYAAGDIARWPDRYSGENIRVEHWVVAQRQGQAAARNILGLQMSFDSVPFFWTQHYDAALAYLGHASSFNEVQDDGDPANLDYSARLLRDRQELARITIFRDRESLEREAEMEAAEHAKVIT